MKVYHFWGCLLFVHFVAAVKPAPRCLNHEGEPVDWWFIYKACNVSGEASSTGFQYVYRDSTGTFLKVFTSQIHLPSHYKIRPLSSDC